VVIANRVARVRAEPDRQRVEHHEQADTAEEQSQGFHHRSPNHVSHYQDHMMAVNRPAGKIQSDATKGDQFGQLADQATLRKTPAERRG
jgi:hypothetical protein